MNAYKLLLGQKILVNTLSGDAFLGLVREVNRGAVFLAGAELINRDGRQKLDGECIIPADNVAWIQVVR